MNSIRDIPLFASIDDSLEKRYSPRCEWTDYEEHELVFADDPGSRDLRCVISGRVRVMIEISVGKQIILGEMGEGEFFGEIAAIDDDARSANVTTLSPCRICIVPQRIFQTLLWESREVNIEILRVLTKRIRLLNSKLAEQFFLPAGLRLCAEILRLSHSENASNNQRVITPVPQVGELADRIGTSVESIGEELNALEKEGLIEQSQDGLVLIDVPKIQRQISQAWTA